MYCGVRLTCIILYNIVMCSPNKSSWPASRERFAQTFRLSLSFQTTAHQPDHYNIIIMYPTRGDFTHTRTTASVLAAGFPAVKCLLAVEVYIYVCGSHAITAMGAQSCGRRTLGRGINYVTRLWSSHVSM